MVYIIIENLHYQDYQAFHLRQTNQRKILMFVDKHQQRFHIFLGLFIDLGSILT